jgi:hypothetical protein
MVNLCPFITKNVMKHRKSAYGKNRYLNAKENCIKKILHFVSYRSPSLFYLLVHSRCRGCLFSCDHTQTHTTVGRTPLDGGSAPSQRPLPQNTNIHKRETSMPPVGFEPMILDRKILHLRFLMNRF